MLNGELISQSLPFLRFEDKISEVIQLMNINEVSQLAVVENGIYKGLYSEDLLLAQVDDQLTLGEIIEAPQLIAVFAQDHFYKALKLTADLGLDIVPVIKENSEYAGVITNKDLLIHLAAFFNLEETGGLIVLEMEGKDYSFSEISRLVETNDAQITQLNTLIDKETGTMLVTIKVNKLELSDIVSTFQRYEYLIKYYFGEEFYENEIRSNYDNLMNYLKV